MTPKKDKTVGLLSYLQSSLEDESFVPIQRNLNQVVQVMIKNFIYNPQKSTDESKEQFLSIEEIKETIKEEILNEISELTERKINLIMTTSFFIIAIVMLSIGFLWENLVYKIYGLLLFTLMLIHSLWVIINERKTREIRNFCSRI